MMKKSLFPKLIVVLLLCATLIGAIQLTSFAETPTKILMNKNISTDWKYLDNNTDPAAGLDSLQGWTAEDFDDSAWKEGKTSFGASYNSSTQKVEIGEVEERVPVTLLDLFLEGQFAKAVMPTYFFRTTFTIDDIDAYSHLIYTLDITGGVVIYLNGTVLLDSRLTKNETTNLYYSDTSFRHLTITHETKDIALKEGKNTLAVEFHTRSSTNGQIYFGFNEMKLIYEDASDVVAEQLMMNVGSSENERNLAWFSGFSEAGEVRLAKASDVVDNTFPTENYKTFAVSSRTAINLANRYAKKATLTDLEPSTEYAYMIVGNGHTSEIRYFETGAGNDFSFVYVGDPQLGAAYADEWKDTVDKIVENFNPEFLLSGGDQLDNGLNETVYSSVFYRNDFATLPFAPTMGPGHDAVSTFDSSATYNDHYNVPNMSDTHGVTDVRGNIVTANYWFTYNNTLFINLNMMDAEAVTNGEHRAFIEDAIRKSPDVKWHIVVMHNSLYSTGMHGNPEYKHYHKEIGLYRPLMSEMFTELGIDVVLSAHDHVYVRSQMMDGEFVSDDLVIGNKVQNPEGVLYLCATSSSNSKYYDCQVKDAYFVAKESYQRRKMAVRIDITDTSFTMSSYFLDDMSVFDTFTIEKGENTQEPTDPLETPYGRIPEGGDPAIAVFDTAGNFIAGYDNFRTALRTHYAVNSDVVIYLRKSITHTETDHDCGKAAGTKIIDLGGHTLTMEEGITLFYTPAKGTGTAKVTVMNGKINANGNTVWLAGNNKESVKNKVINATFDNITFTNLSKSLVSDYYTTYNTYTNNLTFNNCTFQNVTAPLFKVGSLDKGIINITIKGCTVKNNTSTLPAIFNMGDYMANVSVSFQTEADSHALLVYVQKSDDHPESIDLNLPGNNIHLVQSAGSQTTSHNAYVLGEITEYGTIDEEYLTSPIIVFGPKGNILGGYSDLTEVFNKYFMNDYTDYGKNHVIFFREDATYTTVGNNMGKIIGPKTLDLNGHTLTIGANVLFHMNAKNNFDASVLFKNGTVNVNNKVFWAMNCNKVGFVDKLVTATFENITFTNIGTNWISVNTQENFAFQHNLIFNNCTFDIGADYSASVFNLSGSSLSTIDIQVNGGKFILGNNTYHIFSTTRPEKHTFAYGAYNGQYPIFALAGEIDTTAVAEISKDGTPLALYRSMSGEENVYTLSPFAIVKTYLNLTNDLNLVYRVVLPCGYENPVATFAFGAHTFTVTEYTVDENGLYCFKLSAIGPHKMNEVIMATVTTTYNGEAYTVTNDKVSVKSYIDTVRAQNADDEKLLALLDALLVYGASAQAYVDKAQSLPEELGALTAVPEYGIVRTGEGFARLGMRLESEFAFRLGISLESFEGVTLEATKGGKTTTYSLADYAVEDGQLTFYYKGIVATELDEEISFTLKSGDTVLGTLTVSANAYLYCANNMSDALTVAIARALYAYGQAAELYAGE